MSHTLYVCLQVAIGFLLLALVIYVEHVGIID